MPADPPNHASTSETGSRAQDSGAVSVVLGVGGGIAAYKAAELARALMERGFAVEVVMTEAAAQFVQPLTFAALTGRKVITGLFGGSGSSEETLSSAIEHIRVAQDNQVLVVAPATADLLARFARGLASDFLTTTYLAFTGPVVLAPAMNTNMWTHPATRENLRTLEARGHSIVEPAEGVLACGMVGPGRLAELDSIVDAVAAAAGSRDAGAAASSAPLRQDLSGETVLVTAGPTQEPLDAVRYLTNRSSGKMGYALAEAAASRGARVILVSGPVNLAEPAGAEVVPVRTALEMRKAVMDRLSEATVVIKAAAVADYYRADAPKTKMKKTSTRLALELDPTPDILAEVGRTKTDQMLIGFAAETDNMLEEAKRKLHTKNCDMVVANLVSKQDTGFEADDNEVMLVLRTGESIPVPRARKLAVAHRIYDEALKLRLALHNAT